MISISMKFPKPKVLNYKLYRRRSNGKYTEVEMAASRNRGKAGIALEIDGKRFGTIVGAANYYGVSRTVIDGWIKTGKAKKV